MASLSVISLDKRKIATLLQKNRFVPPPPGMDYGGGGPLEAPSSSLLAIWCYQDEGGWAKPLAIFNH